MINRQLGRVDAQRLEGRTAVAIAEMTIVGSVCIVTCES